MLMPPAFGMRTRGHTQLVLHRVYVAQAQLDHGIVKYIGSDNRHMWHGTPKALNQLNIAYLT